MRKTKNTSVVVVWLVFKLRLMLTVVDALLLGRGEVEAYLRSELWLK